MTVKPENQLPGASADGETVYIDNDETGVVIVCTYDGGLDRVGIDLIPVLAWVKKYRPDLLD